MGMAALRAFRVYANLLLCGCCLILLVGCGIFGAGSDNSRLTILNKGCEVDISQHGRVAGSEGTSFRENIKVDPDCTVTVIVKDNVNQEEVTDGDTQ